MSPQRSEMPFRGFDIDCLRFHAFFQHVDTYRTDYFLWVTATGLSAAKQSTSATRRESVSDDEVPDVKGEEG